MKQTCGHILPLVVLLLSGLALRISASAVPACAEDVKHYDGYQVLRVEISTQEQFDVLLEYQNEDPTLDFWSGPVFPGGADIMVTQQQRLSIEKRLFPLGISYKVLIHDVEKTVSEQRKQTELAQQQVDPKFWESYQRMDAIFAWMDEMGTDYPNLVTLQTIGTSTQGRPLRIMKLSTGGASRKPTIFIDGTFHAREFISPAVVTWMINELVVNASKYSDILEGCDIYVLPISNPDGYEYAHTTERLWRKTRSLNVNSTCVGTDLNRNFNHYWGGIGTSPNPCSNNYHGPTPCSEPECQAIERFITTTSANWWSYISFHSASQMWLTPWGHTSELPYDNSDMMAMGIRATNALTAVHGKVYKVGPSSTTIYYTSGTSQDWARGIVGIKYSITVELRDTGEFGHMLPPDQIIPSGEETFEALKVLGREVVRQNRCSNLAPISLTSSYTPLGDITVVNGMDTYETGDSSLKTLLIAVYDIYGFSPSTNIWQICDKMTESGVRVVLPDFFRGEPWKREHYPYPSDQEFYEFVKSTSWEESVRDDLIEVLKHYKAQGVTRFGIFGFCFGGRISAMATGEFFDDIRVAAHFHPASVNNSEAALIRSPTILLPGSNDPDMTEYCRLIDNNIGEGACKYVHYRDVTHGYAGGRANWTNPIIRGRAEEAVTLAREFFCEKLK